MSIVLSLRGNIYQRLSLKICFHEIDGSGGQIRSNYVVVNILLFLENIPAGYKRILRKIAVK